ncbi:MAG: hypothetical protein CBC42_03960 [Betaproteobacteria bacterium TMED82]|nr:MAG: hypothetical protein CBC42_03960 [Betaproteobacteria bacterium TMED82]
MRIIRLALVLFLLLSSIWGVSFIYLRISIESYDVFLVSGARVFIAALFLLPFFLLSCRNSSERSHEQPLLFFFSLVF